MFGSYESIFLRAFLFAGTLGATAAARADEDRGTACLFDEDCPTGAWCAEDHCAAPLALGEVCDRHAMCSTGLCYDEHCGALTIDAPLDGVTTREPKLVVRGTAPAFAIVNVGCGPEADVVQADAAGAWLWVPGVQLGDGAHVIAASIGQAKQLINIAIDTTRPALAVHSPAPAAIISDGTIDIRGQVEPGALLTVLVDGQDALAAPDTHGGWAHRVVLGDGAHVIRASAIDPVGNRSEVVLDFDVDLAAPAIVIDAPQDGAIVAAVPERLSGRAEPGSALFIAGHGADVWLTVPATGVWSWLLPDLGDGTHTYRVTAYDRGGWSADDSVTLIVDATAPGVAVSAPADLATVADARPTFRGTADPGTDIAVAIDGVGVGCVLADPAGRWSITPVKRLAEGAHTVVVLATDRAANTTRMETRVTVDLSAPELSVSAAPRELGGPIVLSGTTDAHASLEVRLAGLLVATALADRDGAWHAEVAAPYDGEQIVTVLARDVVGRTTELTLTVAAPSDALAGEGGGCAGGGAGGLVAGIGAVLALALKRRLAARRA